MWPEFRSCMQRAAQELVLFPPYTPSTRDQIIRHLPQIVYSWNSILSTTYVVSCNAQPRGWTLKCLFWRPNMQLAGCISLWRLDVDWQLCNEKTHMKNKKRSYISSDLFTFLKIFVYIWKLLCFHIITVNWENMSLFDCSHRLFKVNILFLHFQKRNAVRFGILKNLCETKQFHKGAEQWITAAICCIPGWHRAKCFKHADKLFLLTISYY